MKDFGLGAKYLNLIQNWTPRVLRQTNTKLEIRGNARDYPDIRVTPLCSSTKYHQIDPGVLIEGFIDHVYRNLIHIYIEEGLPLESCNENHPASYRIGHTMSLL